ncbi:hypothetical protein GE09DRAFT_228381 [Coniochaeta sp. 2T2.1]|nr:hypothetical protein GE09DRAFT_228381 [Coniochaeta sp. 2T2.1]
MDIDSEPGATPGGSGDKHSFRLRRRHQKSRRGCLECKRRHMKCDETRPRCLNCTTVERTCSYKDKPGATDPDVISRASSSGAENHLKSLVTVEQGQTPTTSSHSSTPALPTAAPPSPYYLQQQQQPPRSYHLHRTDAVEEEEDEEPQVNMVHMDLFHHFLTSSYGFVLPQQPISRLVKDVAVRHAIASPFLMHQILAFSARHRSSVDGDPDRAARFRHLATQLQTRAISLFGKVDLNTITPAERVSIFLFSSFIGFQDFCDVLSLRGGLRFEDFFERYLAYVRLHRGVHKVIEGSWHMLRESELRPVLDAGGAMYDTSGTGPECDDLKRRIEASPNLTEEEKEACRFAIRHLQWVFDSKPNYNGRVNVLLAWVAMFPQGFLDLLVAGRREALCILGYYFVLLHFVKDVWFVYESGEPLLGLLEEYLGPGEWAEWLVRPKELIEENREELGSSRGSTSATTLLPGYDLFP